MYGRHSVALPCNPQCVQGWMLDFAVYAALAAGASLVADLMGWLLAYYQGGGGVLGQVTNQ
jgi:hypothetical protein